MKITDAAANKVAEVLHAHPGKNGMRVSIEGGGCSGFMYRFDFEDTAQETDFVEEKNGVLFYVDAISAAYLQDAELDFIHEGFREEYVFRNPAAKSTCGCGSSFSA